MRIVLATCTEYHVTVLLALTHCHSHSHSLMFNALRRLKERKQPIVNSIHISLMRCCSPASPTQIVHASTVRYYLMVREIVVEVTSYMILSESRLNCPGYKFEIGAVHRRCFPCSSKRIIPPLCIICFKRTCHSRTSHGTLCINVFGILSDSYWKAVPAPTFQTPAAT